MAFVGPPSDEIPANPPTSFGRQVPGVGPETAQYGWAWPNEWPNGRVRAGYQRTARRLAAAMPYRRQTSCAAARGRALFRRMNPSCVRRLLAADDRRIPGIDGAMSERWFQERSRLRAGAGAPASPPPA